MSFIDREKSKGNHNSILSRDMSGSIVQKSPGAHTRVSPEQNEGARSEGLCLAAVPNTLYDFFNQYIS